jgi:hypothetical protein
MRPALIALVVALSAPARAEPPPQLFPVAETLGQTDLGLTWDTGAGRPAGGELSATVDWRGIGLLVRADYQIQQQHLVEQEVEFIEEQGSGALGLGLHVSPVRMLDRMVGRVVDGFVEGGLQGGLSEKAGGWALRGGAWIGAGGALRFPIPHRRWLPVITVRWQHRTRQPAFVFPDALTVAVGLATISEEVPRE